jgi:hypothetical protein
MKDSLSSIQIRQFIIDGYVKLENAFPSQLAKEALRILWKDIHCDPFDSSTWTQPVIRLGEYGQEPFRKAANTPLLHTAFDQLVGKGNWIPRNSIGTFPVRFPSAGDPPDTGWHVDGSFPGEDPTDFFSWRINVKSKGRALLMLFLFSDVGDNDAPTRIMAGSHLTVAKLLAPAGEAGLSFMELAEKLVISSDKNEVLATGPAGTVYLCHPFLAHAAQPHRGKNPRFLAQPALSTDHEFELHRFNHNYFPVEIAIRKGVGLDTDG